MAFLFVSQLNSRFSSSFSFLFCLFVPVKNVSYGACGMEMELWEGGTKPCKKEVGGMIHWIERGGGAKTFQHTTNMDACLFGQHPLPPPTWWWVGGIFGKCVSILCETPAQMLRPISPLISSSAAASIVVLVHSFGTDHREEEEERRRRKLEGGDTQGCRQEKCGRPGGGDLVVVVVVVFNCRKKNVNFGLKQNKAKINKL